MESAWLVLDICQLRNVTLDDETLMREVIRSLVSEASQRIDELRTAVEQADAALCILLAHNARGACGNVGAASMAALFWLIEQHARNGHFHLCQPPLDDLSIELDKLRSEAAAV